jgi:GNAT superfamily N-acetyltransferase
MLDTGQASSSIVVRPAKPTDLSEIERMRQLSIRHLLFPGLGDDERQALTAVMPFDAQLVADGTYFVAEVGGRIAAGGGWSRRSALFRGAGSDGREHFLNPETDPAVIRAMYTHPDFARSGLGSLLLSTAEAAARIAGFRSARLIATPSGERLYLSRGWRVQGKIRLGPEPGPSIEVSVMTRPLGGTVLRSADSETAAMSADQPPRR